MHEVRDMRRLDWRARFALVTAVAAVYLIGLWPTWRVRDAVLRAAGFPAYQGVWKLLPHLLLYSTLAALAAAALWYAFARAGMLDSPPLGRGRDSVRTAFIGAFGAIALVVGAVALDETLAIGWKAPDGWSIAGNFASNFYEELIFRGFLLAALTALIRFWPAAVLTSVLWAAMHIQYPWSLQIVIMAIGLLFAWVVRRAGTIWAPWGAHMIMDIVLDSLIK